MKKVGRGSWNRLLVSLLIVVLGVLVLSLAVSAEEPEAQLGAGDISIKGPLAIELVFDETGAWTANATLEGVELKQFGAKIELDKLELKDQSPDSLKATFSQMGMALDIPEMDPKQIAVMADRGIGVVAIREMSYDDYHELGVYVNNQLLIALQASPGVVTTAIDMLGVDKATGEMVTNLLKMGEVTVVLRFPTGAASASFDDVLDVVSAAPDNMIAVGATLSRMPTQTNIVSLVGVSSAEINDMLDTMSPGLMMPNLATTFLTDFDIEQIGASFGPSGLEVIDSNGRWAKLLWDQGSREAMYGLLPVLGDLFGMALPLDATTQSIIEKVLTTTGLDVTVYDAAEPQEGLPTFAFGKPFVVNIGGDGILSVEGMPVGMMDAGALEAFAPIAVKLDGARREARISINDTPMPYLFLEEGGLATVASIVFIEGIPWDKVEDLVGNVQLELVVTTDGEMPAAAALDYAAGTVAKPFWRLVPKVAVDPQGHIGVGEPPLRISSIIEAFGYPIEQIVWPYVTAYGDKGRTISILVNGNAVAVGINDDTVGGIRWDADLRANVVGLFPLPALPFGLESAFPDWTSQLTELLVQAEWGVEIGLVDQVPPSGFEPYLDDLGAVLPFLGL